MSKPKYCCWVLNYRCVLKCRMCFIWRNRYDPSFEPTFEQKKKFIESLKCIVAPNFEVHLSGGEPLLDPQLFKLIDVIAGEGYRTNVVTNGYLIDKTMAKRIADSKLDTLTISLDGYNEKIHDFIRGVDGAYKKVQEAIKYLALLKNERLKLSILTVIMKPNLDEILPLVEWVNNDKRLDIISFQAITQPFSQERDDLWYLQAENSQLWPDDITKVTELMEKLFELKNKNYKIGNKANHFKAFAKYFSNPAQFLKTIKCNLGDYEFHIDADGKVFFCCFMEKLGNIKNNTLSEIWASSHTQCIRNDIYNCRRNCHIMVNCFYEDEMQDVTHIK